jgi:hypothetical protein
MRPDIQRRQDGTLTVAGASHSKQVNDAALIERQLTKTTRFGDEAVVQKPHLRRWQDNGYSTMVLPSVNEAIRLGDYCCRTELADLPSVLTRRRAR